MAGSLWSFPWAGSFSWLQTMAGSSWLCLMAAPMAGETMHAGGVDLILLRAGTVCVSASTDQ